MKKRIILSFYCGMYMTLPDPRFYPRVNPNNPLVRTLMAMLTEHDAGLVQQKRKALDAQLQEVLTTQDHAALNAALTQAPSHYAYSVLWEALRQAVEQVQPYSTQSATLFAIPVVLVAGIKGHAQLPGKLADIDAVTRLLKNHEVIDPQADVYVSSRLAHPEQLAGVSPAQLALWRDQLQYASGGLPTELAEAPVALKDEGVFTRFLIGIAIQKKDAAPAIRLNAKIGAWGVPLAQEIGRQLETKGVTLFTIPRAPQTWLAAQESGRITQNETRLQVATSNALRSIRSAGRTPVVVMAAHESGEIRITFSAEEDGERWEGFVWPLAPLDDTAQILAFAQELFAECHVDEVRVIDTVQPDKQGEIPFFVTAHIPPVSHH